ncbi:MAG: phage holin family protein [Actinomycetota bacterium]|nr:phage holin family protein [Actinomycetota bacterium]
MPGSNGQQDNLAAALTEVSERITALVRDEIELAKAEMTEKVSSIARGAAAVGAGAVFGVFAFIFLLLTIAWAINDASGDLWLGFLVVLVVLLALTAGAFVFAWRKLKVGAPKPTMAIDEAKKIRATVTAKSEVDR